MVEMEARDNETVSFIVSSSTLQTWPEIFFMIITFVWGS